VWCPHLSPVNQRASEHGGEEILWAWGFHGGVFPVGDFYPAASPDQKRRDG
jgi:hypothetical protein